MSFDSYTREEEQPARNGWGRVLGYGLAVSLALGAFFSGLYIGQEQSGQPQTAGLFNLFITSPSTEAAEPSAEPDLDEFWRVWDLLEQKFATASSAKKISETERIQGAIDGLVDAYDDPYTVYLPPKEASAFGENISGNFSGVGMEVGMRDGLITVIAPLPDTPAEKAGIHAGDVVVRINGTSTEDMRLDEAVQLIRGERGTEVVLQVFREGESELLDIPIIRDTIDIPTVRTEIVDDTFILRLYSFNAVAEEQVNQALREYLKSDTDSFIFDVRGNPGGYMQSAVAIASYFLPAGKVVVEQQFSDDSKDEIFRSYGRQIQLFTPKNLVVLVDKGSASAAEILAGALKDHNVATVIGTQTFGKGSVQELVELEGGSSLKVTVARWLTPNGVSISDGGLTPDIIISRTAEDRAAEIDPQQAAAIDFLQGKEVTSETFEEQVADKATSTPGTGE